MKVCSKCGLEKAMTEFFKSGVQKSGQIKSRGDCKECSKKDTANWRVKNRSEYNNYVAAWRAKNPDRQHATEIKRRYKLPLEEYNRLLAIQNLQCKICFKQHDPATKRGRLYVDHDHANGNVRGLLCGGCNSALGHMNDKAELFLRAATYLQS